MTPAGRLGAKGTAVLLTLGAFTLRVHGLDFQSLWRDEVDSIHFATRDLSLVAGMFLKEGENGPLYFALLRPWIHAVGTSDFALRYSSLLFGVLIVPLIFILGRRVAGDRVGLLGALLASLSPYLIWYSQELKMYALITVLSALSASFLTSALLRNRWRHWMGFVLVTTLNLFCHLLAVLVIPFGMAAFAMWPRKDRNLVRRGLVAFGFLLIPYLPLAAWQMPLWVSPFTTGHPEVPPGSMLSSLLFAFSMNAAPIGEMLPVSLFVFLLLAGSFLYRSGPLEVKRRRFREATAGWKIRRWVEDRWAAIFLGLYLVVPILGIYLISLGMPIFTDRYLIIAIPSFFILLAMGLVAVGDRVKLLLPVCLLLVALIDVRSLAFQSQTPIKSDFRTAARYVRERVNYEEPFLFLIPYVEKNFRHYHGNGFLALEAPYTNGDMTAGELSVRMEGLADGHDALWLISSEPDLWDSRRLVQGWLEEHGTLTDSGEFARVNVYRYDLSLEGPGDGEGAD
jgi:4-amino-4-deoxy-L-arabinose transferase-like glycosyltransferase